MVNQVGSVAREFAENLSVMNDRMGVEPMAVVSKDAPLLNLSLPIHKFSDRVAELLAGADGRWGIFNRYDEIVAVDPDTQKLRPMTAKWFCTWFPKVRGVLPYVRMKLVKDDEEEETRVPVEGSIAEKTAGTVLESSAVWSVLPVLKDVNKVRMPVFDRDEAGKIVGVRLLDEGYDPDHQVLTQPEFDFPEDLDAGDAVEYFNGLFRHFLWRDAERDWSIVLASMLTMFGRYLFTGRAPMFVVNANTQGSGKSVLGMYGAAMVYGVAKIKPLLKDGDGKLQETLNSEANMRSPYVIFDNVDWGDTEIKSPLLDAFITGDHWDFRGMHTQKLLAPELEQIEVMTGNQLRLSADLERRSLMADLWSPVKVQDRSLPAGATLIDAKFMKDPENRKKALGGLWAIIRGWVEADMPQMQGARLASFEGWAEVVPSIVWWAGRLGRWNWNCLAAAQNDHIGDTHSKEIDKMIKAAIARFGVDDKGNVRESFEVEVKQFASVCRLNGLLSEKLWPEADIESVWQTEGQHNGWRFIKPVGDGFNPDDPDDAERFEEERIQQASEYLSAKSRSRFGKELQRRINEQYFQGTDGFWYEFRQVVGSTPAKYRVERKVRSDA